MTNFRSLTYTEDFRRYVCVQLALIRTGEAVGSYTESLLNGIHRQILTSVHQKNLPACTKGCSQQHNKHATDRWCATCKEWKKHLENALVKAYSVQWEKMKSWEWHKDCHNIAEVFIQPGWSTDNVIIQDLATSLSIWAHCKLTDKVVIQTAKPLKDIRNAFTHSAKVTLTDDEKTKAFQEIQSLLRVPVIQACVIDHNVVITGINDLELDCSQVPTNATPTQTVCNVTIVSREEWNARRPTEIEHMGTPVSVVIIHHSATGEAFDQNRCSYEARHIQNFHMDDRGWADVGYNFLVGEDGRVYEGRGWDRVGAHTFGWNRVAISVCFMGDYTSKLPSKVALITAQLLIEEGVKLKKISPDYRLYGHRDLRVTGGPGQHLYNLIRTWSHYDHNTPVKPEPTSALQKGPD